MRLAPTRRPSRTRALGLSIAAATAVLALVAACSVFGGSGPRYSVLFVSVDTLRADRLHAYGYERQTSPNVDALAKGGVLFRQASAQKGSTWPSLTSVLTGKYPISHGVRRNGEQLDPSHVTIAEILRDQGYRTGAFLTNMTTAPNRGFETIFLYDDLLQEQTFWDREVTSEAVAWLRALPRDQKFFAWLHLMDPHKPYHPPAPYDTTFDPEYVGAMNGDDDQLDEITLGRMEVSERDLAHIQALYDGQVLSSDRYVGEMLKALDDAGRRDDTIVVFFTDHGEELYDHNRYFFHSCSMYDGVTNIALVMRLPGELPAGKSIDAQVEEIDILPTVLELVGDVPFPRSVEGETLLPLIRGTGVKKNPYAFIEYCERPSQGRILAIRDTKWKYIYNPEQFEPKNPPYSWQGKEGFPYEKFELYDLVADPREKRNVFAERPEIAKDLQKRLLTWFGDRKFHEASGGFMSPEILKQMKELGYIGRNAEFRFHLRDGRIVEGSILRETDTEYVIKTKDGKLTIPKEGTQIEEK